MCIHTMGHFDSAVAFSGMTREEFVAWYTAKGYGNELEKIGVSTTPVPDTIPDAWEKEEVAV